MRQAGIRRGFIDYLIISTVSFNCNSKKIIKGIAMKMMRNSVLVVVLLLVGAGKACGMDQLHPFHNLPIELKMRMVFDVIGTSDSLEKAIEKIKTLASTDGLLAKKLNASQFCLQVIKQLAKKFDISDEEAARMFGTTEAIRRLEKLQDPLHKAIGDAKMAARKANIAEKNTAIALIKTLIINQQADVNFVYEGYATPLFLLVSCISDLKHDVIELITLFLKYGGDPEFYLLGTRNTTTINLVKDQINGWRKAVARYKQGKHKGAVTLEAMEEQLELYSTVLEMFEDAVAKKHGQ